MAAGCTEGEAFAAVLEAGLPFPLLAKPFWTDGRQGSHGLALLEGAEGLRRLVRGTGPPGVDLPVMLQPFIEHGGCLFKVGPSLHTYHTIQGAEGASHSNKALFSLSWFSA